MMDKNLKRALGRKERKIPLAVAMKQLMKERVMVMGAAGEVGRPLVKALKEYAVPTYPTDIDISSCWGYTKCDITEFQDVLEVTAFFDPTVIINLAAAKLAPAGEIDPWRAVTINLNGVKNLLDVGRRVVQASTCKAVEPQTCYGASKLMAERLVLNYGGTVIRYVNVPECGPSMVTIWNDLPKEAPIPVTPCTRYIMTVDEAVALTVWGATMPAGRYKLDAGDPVTMADYASRYFPNRDQVRIPPRRGDRLVEPHHGDHEEVVPTDINYIERIEGNGDKS